MGTKSFRGPRQNSRALWLLSALVNGTVDVYVDVSNDLLPYPGIHKLIWNLTHADRSACNIDIERILKDAKTRHAYNRIVRQLEKRRFARLKKRGDRWILVVTEKGRQHVHEIEIKQLTIATPKKWDRRWRIVLFDIPEKRSYARAQFRENLKRIGFFSLQKSAFVFPYSCENELDALIQYLKIEECVTFFTTDSLGYQEAKALHFFELQK